MNFYSVTVTIRSNSAKDDFYKLSLAMPIPGPAQLDSDKVILKSFYYSMARQEESHPSRIFAASGVSMLGYYVAGDGS